MNPLFPDESGEHDAHQAPGHGGYVLPHQHGRRLEPGKGHQNAAADSAVELIRRKIDNLYGNEPNARKELAEAKDAIPRSKHQQFMYELSTSGKPLAAIQTAWHNYYLALSDEEKREVWREFYAASGRQPSAYTKHVHQQAQANSVQPEQHLASHNTTADAQADHPKGLVVVSDHMPAPEPPPDRRSFATIKKQVNRRAHSQSQSRVKAKQHLQSLAFGLGLGAIVLVIMLFGLFNQVIIAPFIRPGSNAAATPIILSTSGVAPSGKSEVIIPKINVQLPLVYDTSTKESDLQSSLENGVAHYPTTVMPGQQGNAAFFGHSSNNIFNKGKYKFAFVLLHELEPGDIFYLTRDSKLYTYKVYEKRIVDPTEIGVLNPVPGKTATAVLITCDPPGTSLHRLVVWGEQINPDPTGNNSAAPASTAPATQQTKLPSDSPSLWSRIWSWL